MMNKLSLKTDFGIFYLNEEQMIEPGQQGIKTIFDTKFREVQGQNIFKNVCIPYNFRQTTAFLHDSERAIDNKMKRKKLVEHVC